MKKPMLLVLIGAILVSAIITGFLFLRGNEDTWLCQNGQWIAHGHPSSAQPTSGCGLKQTEKSPTGAALPNIPNSLFTELPSETLQCEQEVQLHALMQPVFTGFFEEVKTKSCGVCGKSPVCVQYIPKYTFTALDIDAIQSKLLALGYKEYDAQKRDLKTDTVTFGITKQVNNKPFGIFFSFSLTNHDVTMITEL